MKCPECSEDMKEGYIFLSGDIDAGIFWLVWSMTEPKSLWNRGHKEDVVLLRFNLAWWRGKEDWLRRAYRCEKCGLLIFREKYTPSSEEMEKMKPKERQLTTEEAEKLYQKLRELYSSEGEEKTLEDKIRWRTLAGDSREEAIYSIARQRGLVE